MSRGISLISILIVHLQFSFGIYTEVAGRKYKGDGVNVINKGVWVKNKQNADRQVGGAFLFRGMAESDYPQVDVNSPSIHPIVSKYFERSKRSSIATKPHRNHRFRKSINNCVENVCKEDNNFNTIEDKPSLVFKDYPYTIDILLSNNKVMRRDKNYAAYAFKDLNGNNRNISDKLLPKTHSPLKLNIDSLIQKDITKPSHPIDDKASISKGNIYNRENTEAHELTKEVNKTGHEDLLPNKVNRDVIDFDLKDSSWRSSSPIGSMPILANFKVKSRIQNKPVEENKPSKLVNEKGVLKVLGVLTKTFKKIMRQHQEIKAIEKNVHGVSEDISRNFDVMSKKLRDFDAKIVKIVKFYDRIKLLEDKLKYKELQYNNKEQELSKNLMEFQNQQQKFLAQQRQFYSVQKFMLEQNEKISTKQNDIAKTQSEISYRQNHFAHILKKNKQTHTVKDPSYDDNKSATITLFDKVKDVYTDKTPLLNDNKPLTITLFDTSKKTTEISKSIEEVTASTVHEIATTTDSVKINLFSLQSAAKTKLENQDSLLLKDKDYNSIDDLVYRYYFNNTFIDDLMKGFVSTFLTIDNIDTRYDPKNIDKRYYSKIKRQELAPLLELVTPLETTILLPVNKTDNADDENSAGFEVKPLNRKRRWIKNHVTRKWNKKHHKHEFKPVTMPVSSSIDNDKRLNNRKCFSNEANTTSKSSEEDFKTDGKKDDPYKSMATNFCNAIGQNSNAQELGWCVEKSLRKLKNIAHQPVPSTTGSTILKPLRKFVPNDQAEDVNNFDRKFVPIIQAEAENNLDSTSDSISTVQSIETSTLTIVPTTSETASSTYVTVLPTEYTQPSQTTNSNIKSFPDNEQLESNLKQYDLKPDTEGTVYYDGSLHASDIIDHPEMMKDEDEDYIMPYLDSNSKIDDGFYGTDKRQRLIRRMMYEMRLKRLNKLRLA